jgi:hypothetical protein
MKKLLGIAVLGLFLSGCDSANNANVIYLKCTTTKAGMYVTGHYGTELGDVNYFEINLNKKNVKARWDPYNGKFTWKPRKLLSVGEKYIRIEFPPSEFGDSEYEQIDRETGKMTHKRMMAKKNRQTPVSMCVKINKEDLPIQKTKKKF